MPRPSSIKKRMRLANSIKIALKEAQSRFAETLTKPNFEIVECQRDESSMASTTTTNNAEMNDVSSSNDHSSRRGKRRHSSVLDADDERDVRQPNQHCSKSPSICSSTDTTSARLFPSKKLSGLFCCLAHCHVSCASRKRSGQFYELFPLPKLKSARLKWALYVAEIDRFANTHPIDNCRVCELHFVDRKPTKRNPFPTQNLQGSNYNRTNHFASAVKDSETLNGSAIGRASGESSILSASQIVTEVHAPMQNLKATSDVVRSPSTLIGQKSGIAFNTRSSRNSVLNFQTSTPLQSATVRTPASKSNSQAISADPLADHRSIERRLLSADREALSQSRASGKNSADSKKHFVRVSKLPDGNIQLTAVPKPSATGMASDSASVSRPSTRVIKVPSLSRVTLNKPSSVTASSDPAQPESLNSDVDNHVTRTSVPAAPQTANSASTLTDYLNRQRQNEHFQKPCGHCGDRLDEIKKDLKRLEEKFDSMLTVFSTFLLTTTPLQTQSSTSDVVADRMPPVASKISILPPSSASLKAPSTNTSLQSETSSSVVQKLNQSSVSKTISKRPVTTIIVNNMNTRQKSVVHSTSNGSKPVDASNQKDMPQLPQSDFGIQPPKQIPSLSMPDEIMPILFPENFKHSGASTTNKEQMKTANQCSEKSEKTHENAVPPKMNEKRTISDDDPELIIECEMEIDENFMENSALKDSIQNIENHEKETDEENMGPLIIDETGNEFGEKSSNASANIVETPSVSMPISQRVVNQAVVRAALLFAGRGLSVDHMKTCGPSWLGGIPDNEIYEALKYLVSIDLIESIGVREFSEVSSQYDSCDSTRERNTTTHLPKLKIEAFRKHLPDEYREKTLLDCGIPLSAFLQAYNRKASSKTEQLNEFCNF